MTVIPQMSRTLHPAGTCRLYNVALTPMQRHADKWRLYNVTLTSVQRLTGTWRLYNVALTFKSKWVAKPVLQTMLTWTWHWSIHWKARRHKKDDLLSYKKQEYRWNRWMLPEHAIVGTGNIILDKTRYTVYTHCTSKWSITKPVDICLKLYQNPSINVGTRVLTNSFLKIASDLTLQL